MEQSAVGLPAVVSREFRQPVVGPIGAVVGLARKRAFVRRINSSAASMVAVLIEDTLLRNTAKKKIAGTASPTPSNVSSSASEIPPATSTGLELRVRHGDHAEAGDHPLERSQQPDHRPQRAEDGQHADLLFHFDDERFADALHGVAGFGQALRQFGQARRQHGAEERVVPFHQLVDSHEVFGFEQRLALLEDFGGAATSIRMS